jgi:ubiquinone/menaquinone biosynthesis C-methylase UbiE
VTDVWASFNDLDTATQDRLAAVLETRGATAQQRGIRRAFLESVPFPPGARVLEVGCGTGVLTRVLATWPDVAQVVGVDLATALVARARELAVGLPNARFDEGDARALGYDDGSFDVVVFDSTLSHVPEPIGALTEAFRVLASGGTLAAFDGDYTTTTVAIGPDDPLQVCVSAMMNASLTNRYVMRRLASMALEVGFVAPSSRSHGFVETQSPDYMLTLIDRGADLLGSSGRAGPDLVAALKQEARRRVEAGQFFGHIAYGSLVAQKPGRDSALRNIERGRQPS